MSAPGAVSLISPESALVNSGSVVSGASFCLNSVQLSQNFFPFNLIILITAQLDEGLELC